jgi:hypothetical protein
MIWKYSLTRTTESDYFYSLADAVRHKDFEFIYIFIDKMLVPFYHIGEKLINKNYQFDYQIKYDFWRWLFHNYEIDCTDEETNLEKLINDAIQHHDVDTLVIFFKLGVKFSSSFYFLTLFLKQKSVFLLFYNNFKIPLPNNIDAETIKSTFSMVSKIN